MRRSMLRQILSKTALRHRNGRHRSFSSFTSPPSLASILRRVEEGTMSASDAERVVLGADAAFPSLYAAGGESNDDVLESFANLDHSRADRTGFPEAIYADGKTPHQVVSILESMAGHVNDAVSAGHGECQVTTTGDDRARTAILATRVDKDLWEAVSAIPLQNGTVTYHEMARIISMRASALPDDEAEDAQNAESVKPTEEQQVARVVVACAGTTDLPVAEEAAVTLEAAGCNVDRVYDVGVAGLHRIIRALPRLRHPDVGCVIVCAGMDGALPSVVGGLVGVPVVAVPTSVGYGVSMGGVSAMLTMLNSCAPGVAVVNIDNGFGAAALAFKCVRQRSAGP